MQEAQRNSYSNILLNSKKHILNTFTVNYCSYFRILIYYEYRINVTESLGRGTVRIDGNRKEPE